MPEPTVRVLSIVQDPHCTGLFGEKYDFMGEDGKYYNMLSCGTLQVNARMWAVPNSDFTYVNAIGIKVGRDRMARILMQLDLDQNGRCLASLDGFFLGNGAVYFDSGLSNRDGTPVTASVAFEGRQLVVEAGNCRLSIHRAEFDPEYGPYPHLNMDIHVCDLGLLSDGVMPHGVLGQTADRDRPQRQGVLGRGIPESVYRLHHTDVDVFLGHQGTGIIEGSYLDYEVSGPFADDFKYNRFGTAPTRKPVFGFLSQQTTLL